MIIDKEYIQHLMVTESSPSIEFEVKEDLVHPARDEYTDIFFQNAAHILYKIITDLEKEG